MPEPIVAENLKKENPDFDSGFFFDYNLLI
jgi:hypothetical protein